MNSGPLLFLSAFLTLAASFWGLVVAPQLQLGREDLRVLKPSGRVYPVGRMGAAKAGADVYRSEGCVECHTQQVRPRGFGGDIERGWGVRRTVAQDYLRDDPVQLGSLRMGPDLANVGVRHPSAEWHLKHLYYPDLIVPGSTMPPYRFLFEKRKIKGRPSPNAMTFEGEYAVEDGYEVVPTEAALGLVAYLLSLQADAALFEAPLPLPETNALPAEVEAGAAVPPPVINPEDYE